ncbi:MAG TPA: CPBP family glutamic-type intramembrane protease [Croceibacterium sp.]|nr:CPBP family glutamic-type intramembrane protease [Croceibacterium sp.]
MIDLLGEPLSLAAKKAGLSFNTLLAAQIAQGVIVLGIGARIGIWAARRVGLTFPIFDAVAAREPIHWPGRAALIAALAGLAGGGIVVLLDAFIFVPPKSVALSGTQPAAWESFLASFYGGITEEVFLRLFVLSLLALGLRRLFLGHQPRGAPLSPMLFWAANILAALAFGLGHLPATAALAPLTTSLILRAIVLNGVLALIFGELYRRWGLEMAILAHFAADIALHVIPPLVA